MIDADGVRSYINEAGQRMLRRHPPPIRMALPVHSVLSAYGRSLFDFMPAWAARRHARDRDAYGARAGVTVDDSALLYGGGEGGAADGALRNGAARGGQLPFLLMLLCLQRDPPERFAPIGRHLRAEADRTAPPEPEPDLRRAPASATKRSPGRKASRRCSCRSVRCQRPNSAAIASPWSA